MADEERGQDFDMIDRRDGNIEDIGWEKLPK